MAESLLNIFSCLNDPEKSIYQNVKTKLLNFGDISESCLLIPVILFILLWNRLFSYISRINDLILKYQTVCFGVVYFH